MTKMCYEGCVYSVHVDYSIKHSFTEECKICRNGSNYTTKDEYEKKGGKRWLSVK